MSALAFLEGRYRVEGECWVWSGLLTPKGYARYKYKGRGWRVSRLLFLLNEQPLQPYPLEQALHSCDNPACVNPAHIRRGTQRENVADALSRKRWFSDKITHCPQGHEYTDDNTYREARRGKHYRRCRTCVLQRSREAYAASTR